MRLVCYYPWVESDHGGRGSARRSQADTHEMKLHRRFPRSRKVWLSTSVFVFIGAWFLPTAEGINGYMPIGVVWYSFITRNYIAPPSAMLLMLTVLTCCFSLVAVVVGWLLQFPICIAWKYFRRGRSRRPSA